MDANKSTARSLYDVKIDVKIKVSAFRRIFTRNGNMDGDSECYGLPVTDVES